MLNWNISDNVGRFDKTSALAIKARVLLYAASPRNNPESDVRKWERAAEAANEVIQTRKAIFERGLGFLQHTSELQDACKQGLWRLLPEEQFNIRL